MDQDQQIKAALKVLGVRPDEQVLNMPENIKLWVSLLGGGVTSGITWAELVDHAVNVVRARGQITASFKTPVSQLGRPQVERYHDALKNVQEVYEALDPAVKVWFSLGGAGPNVVSRDLTRAKLIFARPPVGRKESSKQKEAVRWAYFLATCRGLKTVTTPRTDNKWAQLSAILYGNPQLRLTEHMRAFKKEVAEAQRRLQANRKTELG